VFDGRILKIDYRNKEEYIFQYGSIVVEMDDEGKTLTGFYVGYSPMFGRILHGRVNLIQRIST
jgi:hypothetical protein